MKIISPRKKVEVSTRVTACSPWRHPARRKQPWFFGQDLSLFVFSNDHDDAHGDDNDDGDDMDHDDNEEH